MDNRSGNQESIYKPVGISARKGLTPDAIPEVSTDIKVEAQTQGCPPDMPVNQRLIVSTSEVRRNWYVLRATYSREDKASDYLRAHGIDTYVPKEMVARRIRGRIKEVEESLVNNLLFAYGTEEKMMEYVYDNVHLPYVRFYYQRYTDSTGLPAKKPLVVPDVQMDSFRKIYEAPELDTIITDDVVQKFKKGQLVRITGGPFEGVVGRVARFRGQQRVGVVVGGLFTAITTYIKNRYLEKVDDAVSCFPII